MRITVEALAADELQSIHQATLEVLAKTGIAIHHAESRRLLQKHGGKLDGVIVKIPAAMVAAAIKTAPKSFHVVGRNQQRGIRIGPDSPPVLGPAAGAVFVQDIKRGRRQGLLADLHNLLALSQSSDCIGVATAGILTPADLPGKGYHLQMMEAAIRICDKPIIGLSIGQQISTDSINMARIAAGDLGQHFVIGIVNSLSPLAWDERMLEAIWVYASQGQPLVVACCSMAGFTSPTTLAMTLVQNNAELLAGIVLAQLINPGTPVVYGNTSTITDMLTMNLCIGAPEYALLSTASAQLARYYGLPFRSGGGLTDAKVVDAQAGIESTTNLFFTMANNVDFALHSLGIMESFLSISYEKWLMDEEICARMMRIFRGVGPLPADACQVIGAVGAGGQYLDQRDTINNFRQTFYRPLVSDRSNWDNWVKKDQDYPQAAHEQYQKRLREFTPPEMPVDMAADLKKYLADNS